MLKLRKRKQWLSKILRLVKFSKWGRVANPASWRWYSETVWLNPFDRLVRQFVTDFLHQHRLRFDELHPTVNLLDPVKKIKKVSEEWPYFVWGYTIHESGQKPREGERLKISKTSLQICKKTEMPQKLFKDAIFSKKIAIPPF